MIYKVALNSGALSLSGWAPVRSQRREVSGMHRGGTWPGRLLGRGFPRPLGAAPYLKRLPELKGCWGRAGSIRGARALRAFLQTGRGGIYPSIQVRSANLVVGPAPSGRTRHWLGPLVVLVRAEPRLTVGPPGGGVSQGDL